MQLRSRLATLFALCMILGCNQINRYPEHIELTAAKFDVYRQLEMNKRAPENRCRIDFQEAEDNFNLSESQLGIQAPNRQEDAREWLQQLQREESGGSTSNESVSDADASGSPSSQLFGEGNTSSDQPAESITTPSGPSSSAFGGNSLSTGGGEEDNQYYSMKILARERPYYTQINLPTPRATAATLVVPAVVQLDMKATDKYRYAVTYDSVDVEITYFLSRTPNGIWACLDQDISITSRLARPDEDDLDDRSSNVPRW